MEDHKIENFEKDHPGVSFPTHVVQSAEARVRLMRGLGERLGIVGSDGLKLVRGLQSTVPWDTGEVPETTRFDFLQILENGGFEAPETVLVNWDRFETVESIAATQLADYFDYIWYPSVDDIEIMDESLKWVLRVDHSGCWSFMKLCSRPRPAEPCNFLPGSG